jgi:hypothetical protein
MFIEENSNFVVSVSTAQGCCNIYFEAKCADMESAANRKTSRQKYIILYITI